MASPVSQLSSQIAGLQQQVNDLKTSRVTYVRAPVVSVDTGTNTFGATIPNPTDGSTATLTGISSPAKFLPIPGDTVTLALSGPHIVFQPGGIAPGVIGTTELTTSLNTTITTNGLTATDAHTIAVAAQAAAATKITTYYHSGAPTAPTGGFTTGDLWVDTGNGNALHRWNGTGWDNVQDAQLSQALSDAATAQATADGKIVTFFQSATPTGQAVGDLWVDTGNGNVLKRWNGTSWVNAQDAGIATANTNASNAVTTANTASTNASTALTTANGKNKVTYSTSAATGSGTTTGDLWFQYNASTGVVSATWVWNGSAWQSRTYGDAVLDSLTAGKITAGTMSAAVTISGRFATALTGARVELNSSGLQKWDSGGNQLVSITGTDNLLTGTFKTALTGRRIEIGVSGTTGQINFTDASGGPLGNLIAYTATGSIEVVALTAPITGTSTAYNSVIVQGNERIYNISNLVTCQYVGASAAFGIDYINAKVSGTTFSRYVANEAGGHVWLTGSAVQRLAVTPNSLLYSRSDGTQIVSFVDGASANRMVFMPTGSTHGSVQLLDNGGGTTASPRLNLAQQDGDGNIIKGFGGHTEIRNNGDTLFAEIAASAFTIGSDQGSKTNVTDATVDAMAKVRGLRPRSYQRRRKDTDGTDLPPGPPELGLVAQEAPPEIVAGTTTSDGQMAINLYAYTTVLAAALQQLDARLAAVEKKGPPSA